jgi:NADPH2:quinone reductase
MRAVRIEQTGGPEMLRPVEVEDPAPGPGEVQVAVAAAGVNFIDAYHRSGLYPLELPAVLGVEAAGTVAAVGDGVTAVAVGDRVAWTGPLGSYAELQVVPADRVVAVPGDVEPDTAAAALLQGMTAHYLTHDTYRLGPGDTALVHAAAGGVGHLLVQVCRSLGATVIGTCGSEEKAELARSLGADHVILYRDEDVATAVERLTDGRGVDVVYDGVGQTTFDASLASLRVRGMLVLYGQASGPVPPVDPQRLFQLGSLFLTRPSLFHHVADRAELEDRAAALFGWLGRGEVEVLVDATLPLDEAAEAHRALEARRTRGKLLLRP